MEDRPFGSDVVDAVARHMNSDHAEDCLTIVRGVAGLREATAARLEDVDATGATFVALVGGREVPARVGWTRRIAERAEIRIEVVALHDAARAALGAARSTGSAH